jgi:VIT1/CCC1 family predicted Fe2+/Mn2+ transporter
MEGEIKVERNHIKEYHAEEMKELSHLLSLIGIPRSQPNLCNDANDTSPRSASARAHDGRKLRRRLTRFYAANPDALLQIMIALEFGVIDEEVRSPFVAGATSLVLFFIGALPSTVPFGFVDDPTMGLIIAGLATGIGLFIVGAVKTWATRGNLWLAAVENLLITACGGAIAYGIGVGFQSLVGEDE